MPEQPRPERKVAQILKQVEDILRQIVPEGQSPESLPVPPGLQGVARRPLPLGKLQEETREKLSGSFDDLSSAVLRVMESSGIMGRLADDAEKFRDERDKLDDGPPTGRGGRLITAADRRQKVRLVFERDGLRAYSDLIQGEIDTWQIQAGLIMDERYEEMYNAGGKAAQRRLGVAASFSLRDPGILKSLGERSNLLTGGVSQTTFDHIRTVVAEEYYLKGKGSLDVAGSLRNEFAWMGKTRSELIARTETLAVTSEAQFTTFMSSGVERKQWLTTLDGRERDTHFDAHGQMVKIDEVFEVGDCQLMYPGDSGSGCVEEIANCRCDHIPVVDQRQFTGQQVWDGSNAPDQFARERLQAA